MKERLLVLAKAAPEASAKYQELVCVAGITENNEWRRIYPLPWNLFWKNSEKNFKKKTWIEYELENDKPSVHRPESRKIKFDSITPLKEASFAEIEKLLLEKNTCIEELEQKGPRVQSLGTITPTQIIDFKPVDNTHYQQLVTKKAQQDLFGKPAIGLEIPRYKYQYAFKDDNTGRTHECLCEDWEAAELYRKCEQYRKNGKYADENEVHEKVRNKMLNITKNNHVHFIIGSHYRFPTYIIIGVIYPRKTDLQPNSKTPQTKQ